MTANVQPTLQHQWLKKMALWLVLLLACLPQFTAGKSFRVKYDTQGTLSYDGRGCTSYWCGEQWRAQRILYYNLTATSKLVKNNQTTLVTTHDCQGTHHSSECEQTGSEKTSQLNTVRVVVLNRTSDEPIEVRDSPELDHYLIRSDNVNDRLQPVSPNYPANLTKIWQYKIPKGCKMHVQFVNFSIERTPKCTKDYFSVQTSKDKDDVQVFCDRLEWIEIKYRKRVQFTLHSDNAVNNGQVAAKVCLSMIHSDSSDCDCENLVERRRRRRRDSNQTMSSNKAVKLNQRPSVLQRLQSARLRQQS